MATYSNFLAWSGHQKLDMTERLSTKQHSDMNWGISAAFEM